MGGFSTWVARFIRDGRGRPGVRGSRRHALLCLVAGALALSLTACDALRAETTGGEDGWVEPANYVYAVDSSCGERWFLGEFRITVSDGVPTRARALDQDARSLITSTGLEHIPTLGELEQEAISAEAEGAALAEVRYADEGYPAVIEIDYDRNAVDDEACYVITHFEDGTE